MTHDGLGKQFPAEYKAWDAMIYRCHDERSPDFDGYGGRGITVCDRWRDSFEAFLVDMGPRPSEHHSIDREDNDGAYDPSNCRWATAAQQANNRRNTPAMMFRGEATPLGVLARRFGIRHNTLYMRVVKYGWDIETAVSTPVGRR